MASEMEGGGVAALVVSSSHVPLRKAAGILRERFGTAFAPVGGIASCEEGAPMLLARGRPFAPAGGQDGLPSVMRDSSQSSTFGVLLWGPGLVASTMTIRGFRQIGPVHTVERATHSVVSVPPWPNAYRRRVAPTQSRGRAIGGRS